MPLTPTQQQFLDTYIREHRISRGKKSEAKKFARRRGKVVAEINIIPDFIAEHGQYQQALDTIDAKADVGDFKDAYRDLEQLKNDARAFASAYDPAQDLAQLKQDISALSAKATAQLANRATLDAWCANQAPAKLAQVVAIPPASVPDRAAFGTAKEWATAMKDVIDAKANDLKQQVADFFSNYPAAEANNLATFLSTANKEVADLKTKARQLAKGCSSRSAQAELGRIAGVGGKFSSEILKNAALAPLRPAPNSEDFCPANFTATTKSGFTQQLSARVDAVKQQLLQLKQDISNELTRGQKGRDQAAPAKPSDEYADHVKQKLAKEKRKDERNLTATAEAPRQVAAREASPLSAFAHAYSYAVSIPTTPPSPADITNNTDGAKNNFLQYLNDRGVDPKGDAVFDLILKEPNDLRSDFKQDLIKARNFDANHLTPYEQQWLDMMADGMAQAIDEFSPSKLDADAGTLDLNGQPYGNPTPIGKGGMGSIMRYESLTNPGTFVAVKTLLSDIPEDREEIVNELKAHRHLMQGDPSARGRDHIVELYDVAKGKDGSLNMVMEVLEGGDLAENRMGAVIGLETGAITEEARNILNQYQMKQAIEGMIYMRDMNMTHVDLKPENFFMTADGKLKVADFGTSRVSDKPDGTIPEPEALTEAYANSKDINDGMIDQKWDTFSLGRTAGALHTKEDSPEVDAGTGWRSNNTFIGDDFTGAFKRLYEAMTNDDKTKRPTLEAALESSYFKNLDEFPAEDVEKLGELSTTYGKLAKKQFKQLTINLKASRPDLVAKFLRMEPDVTQWKYSLIVQGINGAILDENRKIKKLSKELRDASTPDAKKFDLEQQVSELQAGVDRLQKALGSAQSPEMKEIGAEMKALSDRIARPTSELFVNDDDDESFNQVVRQLESTLSDPATFVNYVTMPSMSQFFEYFGVKHGDVVKAAKNFGLDMSVKNSVAKLQFITAHREIKAFLARIAHKSTRGLLAKGLRGVLDDLRNRFDKAHPDEKIDLKKDLRGEERLGVDDYEEFFPTKDVKPGDASTANAMKQQVKFLGALKSVQSNSEKFLAVLNKVSGDEPGKLLSTAECKSINEVVEKCSKAIEQDKSNDLKVAVTRFDTAIKNLKQGKPAASLIRKALLEEAEAKLAELVG